MDNFEIYLEDAIKTLIDSPKTLITDIKKIQMLNELYCNLKKLLDICEAEYTISIERDDFLSNSVTIKIMTNKFPITREYFSLYKDFISKTNAIDQYPTNDEKILYFFEIDNVFTEIPQDD